MSIKINKGTVRKKTLKITFITLALSLLITGAAVLIYGYVTVNSMERDNISNNKEDLGIDTEKFTENDGITNILLMGIDSRSDDFSGRSDSIMVLTVDPVHDKLKLTSLMRDSYVHINGYGYDKLTHAYAYGEGELAINTVNTNFNLNIEDYVVVDFSGLEDMIDSLEGLEISVSEEEVQWLNKNITEQAELRGVNPYSYYINSAGDYHMNGLQAVAYARIRKTSGGDYKRTERQREVLDKMFQKIQSAGLSTFTSFVSNAIPHVKTSLSNSEIISLGKKVLASGMDSIEQCRFPLDDYSGGGYVDERWYLLYDVEATKEQIYNYIFNDVSPYPEEADNSEGAEDINTSEEVEGKADIEESEDMEETEVIEGSENIEETEDIDESQDMMETDNTSPKTGGF